MQAPTRCYLRPVIWGILNSVNKPLAGICAGLKKIKWGKSSTSGRKGVYKVMVISPKEKKKLMVANIISRNRLYPVVSRGKTETRNYEPPLSLIHRSKLPVPKR